MPPLLETSIGFPTNGKRDDQAVLLNAVLESMTEYESTRTRNLFSFLQGSSAFSPSDVEACKNRADVIHMPAISGKLVAEQAPSKASGDSNLLIWHCPGGRDETCGFPRSLSQATIPVKPPSSADTSDGETHPWNAKRSFRLSPGAFSTPSSLSSSPSSKQAFLLSATSPLSFPFPQPELESPLHPRRLLFSKTGQALDSEWESLETSAESFMDDLNSLNPLHIAGSISSSARQLAEAFFQDAPSPPLPKSPHPGKRLLGTPASALRGVVAAEEMDGECGFWRRRREVCLDGDVWCAKKGDRSRGMVRSYGCGDLVAMEGGCMPVSSKEEKCRIRSMDMELPVVVGGCAASCTGTLDLSRRALSKAQDVASKTLRIFFVALILLYVSTVSVFVCSYLA